MYLFPVIPAFATTTNTSQQQALKHVGIYLRSQLILIENFVLPFHMPEMVVISNSTNRQQVKNHFI
jgi:hypothetical protein